MTTRRNILKGGAGLAAILASGEAPAYLVKSMLASRGSFFGRVGGAPLPYDEEVEYLQSTGTQYINTLVTLDSDDVVTLKGSLENRNSFFGVFRNDGTSFNLTGSGSNSLFRFSGSTGSKATTIGTPYTFKCGKTFEIDGEIVRTFNDTFTGDSYCTLFARNQSSGSSLQLSDYLQGKIYWLKIEKSGVLVRDYIPVRVGTVGYMYDRVSGQLFGNAGTGAFSYGRDINPISARSYVNDGLIAMWDGIENAGWGVHDSAATKWKDLTGNGYDLELRNSAHFDINSLVTAERNKVSALLDRTLSYRSIEVCGFADESRNSSALVCFGNYLDSGIMFACFWNSIQTYNGNYNIRFTNPVSARSTWSGTHDGSTHVAYVNGDVAVGTMSTNNWSSRAGTFGLSGSSNYAAYNFVGNYYCVRLYSRAITAAEIAANYAVDKARFNLA